MHLQFLELLSSPEQHILQQQKQKPNNKTQPSHIEFLFLLGLFMNP